jgi:hypothetical protein
MDEYEAFFGERAAGAEGFKQVQPVRIREGRVEEDEIEGLFVPFQEELDGLSLALDALFRDRDVFKEKRELGSVAFHADDRPGAPRGGLEGYDAGAGEQVQE